MKSINNYDYYGFPGGSDGKEFPCNAGDLGLIPGSGRSSEERNGFLLQYFLENAMDRGAWQATAHGVSGYNWSTNTFVLGFPGGASSKETTNQCRQHNRCMLDPWVRKIPWRRADNSLQCLLPGKFHGQRCLVGYSLWSGKKSDMSEHAHTHTLYIYTYLYSHIYLKFYTKVYVCNLKNSKVSANAFHLPDIFYSDIKEKGLLLLMW